MAKKIGIISLGCAKNLVDAEYIAGDLVAEGYELVPEDRAEILIINTCGFIKDAKKESLEVIIEQVQRKKRGEIEKIIVTGCLSQRYGSELEKGIGEIDAIFGIETSGLLVDFIRGELKERNYITKPRSKLLNTKQHRIRLTPKSYAYLRIADGCSNFCSYCAIPYIRGPVRSRKIEEIWMEAENLARDGVKEINIIAQDTFSYGLDLYGRIMLLELLKGLVSIDGIKWIRLLYSYPGEWENSILKFIASEEKICRYLDIPVQHINDKILKRMNRRGSGRFIREFISRLRREIPEVVLRSTVMVGFPGEGDKEFNELLDFIRETRFDRLGVFTYSREEGTASYLFDDQLPERIKKDRYKKAMELQQFISFEKNREMTGKAVDVLIEGPVEGAPFILHGRYMGQAPEVDGCVYITDGIAETGEIVKVEIIGAKHYDLLGRIIHC